MIAQPPQYLVAKYIPDPMRMEPRNIGVILWSAGRATARFLPASAADFVPDKETYERWVRFWNVEIAKDVIHPYRSRPVRKSNHKFLEGLQKTQEGQYALQGGGVLLDDVAAADIDDALAFLFRELVVSPGITASAGDASSGFKLTCDRLIADTGMSKLDGFRGDHPIALSVHGVTQHWKFDYAIVDDSRPIILLLRTRLVELSATSAAYKFAEAASQYNLGVSHCASLIDMRPTTETGSAAEGSHRARKSSSRDEFHSLLKSVSMPIYASDEDEAKQQLIELAKAG